MMRINIYYGGRGLIEDPTIYVINKLTDVLKDLRVEVNRYNLYEDKQGISTLTRTLKECDGVISCGQCRMDGNWRAYAAISRCLLALRR